MDELDKIDQMIEQPKRKRGRPKGSVNKNKQSPREAVAGGLVPTAGPAIIPVSDSGGEGGGVPDLITSCMEIRSHVDLNDPTTLWNAMSQYLQLCSMSGMKISNGLMYLSCGISRDTIHEWSTGGRRKSNPEYRKFALMCKEICSAAREQYGIEGKVNPILTIFHQKFYDGFTDVPKTEEAKDPLGEMQDARELAEKYKDIIMD